MGFRAHRQPHRGKRDQTTKEQQNCQEGEVAEFRGDHLEKGLDMLALSAAGVNMAQDPE